MPASDRGGYSWGLLGGKKPYVSRNVNISSQFLKWIRVGRGTLGGTQTLSEGYIS